MNDITKRGGFLLIDKPAGITSYDVIRQLKKKIDGKIGHAGTLDPFATGLLIILVGQATKLMPQLLKLPKTYEAEITLGATSDTDDVEGRITPLRPTGFAGRRPLAAPAVASGEGWLRGESMQRSSSVIFPLLSKEGHASPPTAGELGEVLSSFRGQIQQIPPAYAAIKVKGKKLYEYAREGKPVQAPPRSVTIYSLDLLDYRYPTMRLRVTCSSGTYIRALGRDIGTALGTGGYLSALRRLSIGPFDVKDASMTRVRPLDELTNFLQATNY